MLYENWYHLYNLKNMENTQGGLLLLVKLEVSACSFTKSNTPLWKFFTFFLMIQVVPKLKIRATKCRNAYVFSRFIWSSRPQVLLNNWFEIFAKFAGQHLLWSKALRLMLLLFQNMGTCRVFCPAICEI